MPFVSRPRRDTAVDRFDTVSKTPPRVESTRRSFVLPGLGAIVHTGLLSSRGPSHRTADRFARRCSIGAASSSHLAARQVAGESGKPSRSPDAGWSLAAAVARATALRGLTPTSLGARGQLTALRFRTSVRAERLSAEDLESKPSGDGAAGVLR